MIPGISFIMRVAKEDDAQLVKSCNSLAGLTVPHHIVICSARPTGNRYEYDGQISRAGYETLVTPASSPHSLPSFLHWCMERGKHRWSFRWDADFVASPELILFLNSRKWDDKTPTRIRFPQSSGNNEPVLFNAGHDYTKQIFWEINASIFAPHVKEEVSYAGIIHESPMIDIKKYWRSEPWFAHVDSEEAGELRRKYAVLVELLGPEPVGLARACNPICDKYEHQVHLHERLLNAHGINLWG